MIMYIVSQQIAAIKKTYHEKFKRNLEKDIMSETSGHFKRLLVSVLQVIKSYTFFKWVVKKSYSG
jgi:hypothetical protein